MSLLPDEEPQLPKSIPLRQAADVLEQLAAFIAKQPKYQRPGWEHLGDVASVARWAAENQHVARRLDPPKY